MIGQWCDGKTHRNASSRQHSWLRMSSPPQGDIVMMGTESSPMINSVHFSNCSGIRITLTDPLPLPIALPITQTVSPCRS